jgi:uroporphyrinogen-III synthase
MDNTGRPCNLAGLGVLVTRPAHQSDALCRRIEQCGGRAVAFPALEILPTREPARAAELLAQDWDLVIYTSANAVRFALQLTTALPTATHIAAVGRATARLLEHTDTPPDLLPARADSEGLLDLQLLRQVAGRRILIVRGEGGRALLGESLSERGARVEFAEVYRRAPPRTDPAPLLQRWPKEVQVVTATSAEVLENLWQLLGPAGRGLLRATPLILISERMEPLARRLGITRTLRADGAGEDALLAAICTLLEPPHDG